MAKILTSVAVLTVISVVTIAAINVLFKTNIPYNPQMILAMTWLIVVFGLANRVDK